jgi:IS4 transposase
LAFAQGPLLRWETRRKLVFLTNQLVLPALTVTRLYKMRREVELFFRWIKQHLRIKHFYGNSANAVKCQIWIAVAVYLMVAILHKEWKFPGTLYRILQILGVRPFGKLPLVQLVADSAAGNDCRPDCIQMRLR